MRGTRAHNRWKIHQTVIVNCPKEANAIALKILNAGVDSIEFQIVPETFSAEDLNTLLKDIHILQSKLPSAAVKPPMWQSW